MSFWGGFYKAANEEKSRAGEAVGAAAGVIGGAGAGTRYSDQMARKSRSMIRAKPKVRWDLHGMMPDARIRRKAHASVRKGFRRGLGAAGAVGAGVIGAGVGKAVDSARNKKD